MAPPHALVEPFPIVGTRLSGIVPDQTEPEEFCPVDLDGLVDDTQLDFNLYLMAGPGRFVFYRSRSRAFTPVHRRRLLDNAVRVVYIRTSERQQYLQYLEHHLDTVLRSEEVPQTKKAKLLYVVSQTVMQDTLEQPRSATIVPRTRQMAERTVDFVLRSERALRQLARLMRADYYTYTHSINVCVFGVALARQVGVERDDLSDYAVGAMLHDLGKTQIPKELITRTGPLTDDEMEVMRGHVVIGEQILQTHGTVPALAMMCVSQHHEKLDASGYPRRLPAEDMHLFGRITAIADCFDAMTSKRSYQRAYGAYETLKLMKNELAPKFDQQLLEPFIKLLGVSRS